MIPPMHTPSAPAGHAAYARGVWTLTGGGDTSANRTFDVAANADGTIVVNANDIQARITSAVQSGSGADIILVVNNWPQLYADSVVDVIGYAALLREIG